MVSLLTELNEVKLHPQPTISIAYLLPSGRMSQDTFSEWCIFRTLWSFCYLYSHSHFSVNCSPTADLSCSGGGCLLETKLNEILPCTTVLSIIFTDCRSFFPSVFQVSSFSLSRYLHFALLFYSSPSHQHTCTNHSSLLFFTHNTHITHKT